MDEADQWNPACWSWTIPDLTHLHSAADPLDAEDEAEEALREWQAGRCAMCGKVEPLRMDHDHRTGLVRGLLCHSCNVLEGVQGADAPLERYRQKSPAIILSITLRYFDQFLGQYAEPEDDSGREERFRRAAKVIRAMQIGDSIRIQRPDIAANGEEGVPIE